ncbi:hypothetical protein [Staphylococcus simulans]|uniref:hypothetical protein n=1 Tax=Staphylococcus simulans TaxID=1286 RepID=UPI001F540892|nr:hypothetical protein [Staphylococcus simulans]
MDNHFLEQLKEILEPYEDIDSNKDGFVYGGYIEWPSLSDYDDFQVEEVLNLLGINIQFGYITDPFEFFEILKSLHGSEDELYEDICNEAIIKKEGEEFNEELNIEQFINSITEYEIQIPTINVLRDSIAKTFEKHGVPEGTQREYDAAIPESSKYWPLSVMMDEELYFMSIIPLNDYKNEIDKVKDKISVEEDKLVKKSLMLTIFVLSESYVSSLILSNLPERDGSSINSTYEKIIQQYISDNIRTRNGRKKLVKEFYSIEMPEMPEMPHTRLRDNSCSRNR